MEMSRCLPIKFLLEHNGKFSTVIALLFNSGCLLFFVSEAEVYKSLSTLQIAKSVGPDKIPNRVLKEFAPELSLVIQDIYNQSIREGYTPELLKSSIISPMPKVTSPQSIESDFRPMEGFFCKSHLSQLTPKIDPR